MGHSPDSNDYRTSRRYSVIDGFGELLQQRLLVQLSALPVTGADLQLAGDRVPLQPAYTGLPRVFRTGHGDLGRGGPR